MTTMMLRRFRFGIGIVAALCLLSCHRPACAQRALPVGSAAEIKTESVILRALDARFSAVFSETPLTDALDAIGHAGKIQVQIDAKSLADAGVGIDSQVTRVIDDISLRSALGVILRPMDLAWIVVNESLVITTKEKADAEFRTVVYPVRDLVTNRNGLRLPQDFDSLIDTITTTIAPTTWDEVGGPGSIAEFRPTSALIVSQTREVHEQIEGVLDALRQAGDLQGVVPVIARPRHSPDVRDEDSAWEQPRYLPSPEAGWLIPRTHEPSLR
jgi:hypothetical protein